MGFFEILHMDDAVVVVDKGPGISTTAAHAETSLISLVEAEVDRRSFGRYGLFPVHRLDKGTSGVLVIARSPAIAARLVPAFEVDALGATEKSAAATAATRSARDARPSLPTWARPSANETSARTPGSRPSAPRTVSSQ